MTAADAGFCWLLFGLSTLLLITGVAEHFLARCERLRVRTDLDRLRRSKLAQKDLIRRADEAWEKVHELSKDSAAHQDERALRFWTEFANAYARATGHTFPNPPPELLATKKIPPRGSA